MPRLRDEPDAGPAEEEREDEGEGGGAGDGQLPPREVEAQGPPTWIQRIWLAFLGGPGYRRLARHPEGAYSAFLAVALSAAIALAAVSGLAVERTLQALIRAWDRLPRFTLTDHGLSLPPRVHAPVRVQRDGVLLLLLPEMPTGEDPLGQAAVGLALAPQGLILRAGPGSDVALPLDALGPPPLTRGAVLQRLRALAGPGLWFVGAVSVGVQLLRDFVRAAIVAWIGLTLARMGGVAVQWPEAWRIGLAAWTLPLSAEVVRLWVPYPVLALWVVAGIYASIGCYSLAQGSDAARRGG